MKKIGLLAAMIAAALLSGCGDSGTTPNTGTPGTPGTPAKPAAGGGGSKAAGVPFPADKATGTVMGTVTLDGEAPKAKEVPIDGDKYCVEKHKDAPAMKEDLQVAAAKGVMNAFVYVKTTPTAWKFDAPKDPVVVEQHGCIYVPHVIGVVAGQQIHVNSKDATTHNVHFMSKGLNESKNVTEVENQSVPFDVPNAEMGDYFKCDVHGWMQCQVEVMDNNLFAISDKDGKFTLPKLPAGAYEIAVWHEKLGEDTKKITVEDGKEAKVDFALKLK